MEVPQQPGRRVLLARATDSRGRTQPMERDPDRGSYEINHCLPIEVEIRYVCSGGLWPPIAGEKSMVSALTERRYNRCSHSTSTRCLRAKRS